MSKAVQNPDAKIRPLVERLLLDNVPVPEIFKQTGIGLGEIYYIARQLKPSDNDRMDLRVEEIVAGAPGQNVRERFDQEGLERLAQSIGEFGILEPLIVRFVLTDKGKVEYHLVAGERRLRAAKLASLDKVPVIVRTIDPTVAAKLNILENLQRETLDPIEEARGYQRLIDDHDMRQAAIAKDLGVSEAHISNRRRLLRLPDTVQREISHKNLSASVALSLVDIAGNADLTAKAAAKMIETNATQQRAPEILDETLAASCPVVQWSGYPYGSHQVTCDQTAHKDCPCRRRVKPRYAMECVVCVDPQQYSDVEGAAQAEIEEKQRKALEKAEAKAEDGVLDLKALKWIDSGREAQYHNVTSPYGGGRIHDCIGDHAKCACLRQGKGPHETEHTRLICIDVKQFNRVERAAKKEQTKAAIAHMATENEQLSTWAEGEIARMYSEGIAMILQPADLAYLAAWIFSSCDVGTGPNYVPRADRQKYLEGWGIQVNVGGYLPSKRIDVAKAFLEQGDPETLLRIIFEWPLIAQGKDQRNLAGWYRAQVDAEAAAADAPAPQSDDDEIPDGPYGDDDIPDDAVVDDA